MQEETATCRICMETSGLLLTPCRCSGTLKYVHDKCLKRWLVTVENGGTGPQCEICKTFFTVNARSKRKCSWKRMLHKNLIHCCLVPLMSLVLIFSVVGSYYFALTLLEQQVPVPTVIVALALLATCAASVLVTLGLLLGKLWNACLVVEWQVQSQVFEESYSSLTTQKRSQNQT